jgi:hypothetical protein
MSCSLFPLRYVRIAYPLDLSPSPSVSLFAFKLTLSALKHTPSCRTRPTPSAQSAAGCVVRKGGGRRQTYPNVYGTYAEREHTPIPREESERERGREGCREERGMQNVRERERERKRGIERDAEKQGRRERARNQITIVSLPTRGNHIFRQATNHARGSPQTHANV